MKKPQHLRIKTGNRKNVFISSVNHFIGQQPALKKRNKQTHASLSDLYSFSKCIYLNNLIVSESICDGKPVGMWITQLTL